MTEIIGRIDETIRGLTVRYATFSGTVSNEGTPESRDIIIYKNPDNENVIAETTSDASGDFSVEVPCGSNDLMRVVCIGGTGENSAVYDKVAG